MTYVDATTGERTELSTTSVANAAAKIANALRDELDLDTGATVRMDLPLHWQRSTWCAGVLTAGCVMRTRDDEFGDIVVTTAARATAGPVPVLAVSLHPFGLPIEEPLPYGCSDATILVRQQPDAYLGEPPQGTWSAWSDPALTQSELIDAGRDLAERVGLARDGRLLVTTDSTDGWLACLAAPLAVGASVVLVGTAAASGVDGRTRVDTEVLERLMSQERITAVLP